MQPRDNVTIGTRMFRTDDTFHRLMSDFEALMGTSTQEFTLPPPIDDGTIGGGPAPPAGSSTASESTTRMSRYAEAAHRANGTSGSAASRSEARLQAGRQLLLATERLLASSSATTPSLSSTQQPQSTLTASGKPISLVSALRKVRAGGDAASNASQSTTNSPSSSVPRDRDAAQDQQLDERLQQPAFQKVGVPGLQLRQLRSGSSNAALGHGSVSPPSASRGISAGAAPGERPSTTGTLDSCGLTHVTDGDGGSPQAALPSDRPSSATSFRSSITSARISTSVQLWEQSRDAVKKERDELEQSLRQRAAERAAWREQRNAREAQRAREKEQQLLRHLQDELSGVIDSESCGREAVLSSERVARGDVTAQAAAAMALFVDRAERERREEQAIIDAARRERQERLQAERVAALLSEEQERWARRVVEFTRDTVWNETYERQLISDVEHRDFSLLLQRFDFWRRHPVMVLQAAERDDRTMTTDERDVFVRIIAAVCVEEGEATARRRIRCEEDAIFTDSVMMPLTCLSQTARFCALERRQRAAIELPALETGRAIIAAHCDAIAPIIERELWLHVVAEAEARMLIEQSERRGIEVLFDGNANSRQLVAKYTARVDEVRRQQLEYRERKVREFIDDELATRILLQQRAAEDRILIMEYFNRDREKAEQRAQERRKSEVEQAIRAAQMLHIAQADDVTYKQQQQRTAGKAGSGGSSGTGGAVSAKVRAPTKAVGVKK